MAVEKYFAAETAWVCEIDKYASQVIEQRIQRPNFGDLKSVDWSQVEPIDILTAGYPCQPFSHAGYRKGDQDERHLWPHIREIISILRPSLVILENVRGHLTLGFSNVLADLTKIGYDARWEIVRASDVGAPHKRERLFVIAYSDSKTLDKSRRTDRNVYGSTSPIINGTDREIDRNGNSTISHTINKYQSHDGEMSELRSRLASRCEMSMRVAPNALDDGKLNAKFVEYMMGLPEGWVTDTGLSRAQQLKMLGNGVVPQQAYFALQILMGEFDTPTECEK